MATSRGGVTLKEGGGDPIGDQGNTAPPRNGYYGDPGLPGDGGGSLPTNPTGGGGWRVPVVAPNFTYPQGLLNQIQQSLQVPMGYGGQFGRFGFSQGTSTPATAPATWGRAPPLGQPWTRAPVSWGFPPFPNGGGMGAGGLLGGPAGGSSGPAGGLLGGGGPPPPAAPPPAAPPPAAPPPAAPPPAAPPAPDTTPLGSIGRGGLTEKSTTPPAASGTRYNADGSIDFPAPNQPGLMMHRDRGQWEMMPRSYWDSLGSSASGALAGFNAQPNTQAQVEYIMRSPSSSLLLNNPAVQAALGPNWRNTFVNGYYNAPPR